MPGPRLTAPGVDAVPPDDGHPECKRHPRDLLVDRQRYSSAPRQTALWSDRSHAESEPLVNGTSIVGCLPPGARSTALITHPYCRISMLKWGVAHTPFPLRRPSARLSANVYRVTKIVGTRRLVWTQGLPGRRRPCAALIGSRPPRCVVASTMAGSSTTGEHEGRLPDGCVTFTGVLPAAGQVSTAAVYTVQSARPSNCRTRSRSPVWSA
jgi:hypothetical protein